MNLERLLILVIQNDDEIVVSCIEDILANFDRDPACTQALLTFYIIRDFKPCSVIELQTFI